MAITWVGIVILALTGSRAVMATNNRAKKDSLYFYCPRSNTWQRKRDISWYCKDCHVNGCKPGGPESSDKPF